MDRAFPISGSSGKEWGCAAWPTAPWSSAPTSSSDAAGTAAPNSPAPRRSPREAPMSEHHHTNGRARVFLVDDHPLVRESLARLINQQSDMEVCGEAEDVDQALREISASGPDAAIVDISLQGSSGLELIKTLK